MSKLLVGVGQAAATVLILAGTFIVACLLAFAPLTALPGELQTDFVNGSWVFPVGIVVMMIAVAIRVGSLESYRREPWWPSTRRFMWSWASGFVAFWWVAGLLIWANAFAVQKAQSHDMSVFDYEERRVSGAVSTINHYKLAEIGTSWKTDLQPAPGREFLKVGSCVRVLVHEGRLGLNWIGEARPITCPASNDR